MGNKWAAWMLIPVLTVTTAACGNGIDVAEKSNDGVSSPVKSVSTEPVTLSLYNNAGIADSYMEEYVLKHIKSKYPHMTVNYLKPETGKTLNDLISAGSIPDIVLCTISNLLLYTSETGLLTDLTPLIKEQGMDIGKFKDGLIDAIKSYSDKGEIYALPWSINQVSVYYNKDLFDKFGVSYPKDGMTWEQLNNVGRQMTRNVDGVQIRGLDISGSYIVGLNPLSLPIVNPQTEQAAVNTDQWKRLFETLTSPYQITGNSIDEKTKNADEAFIEQTLAIRVGNAMFPKLLELENKGTSFNWDLAAMPSFQEAPQTNVQFNGALFGISGQSRYKAQAMQVLALLSSEEVHMEGSRIARQTTLNNTDIQKAFGKDNGSMGTKNILSVQSLKIAKSPKPTLYDTAAKNVLNNKLRDVQLGKKDINTALREADEEINKKIAEEKLRKK